MTILTHPTYLFAWIANHESIRGHILCDYRAGSYKSILSNDAPTNNGGIGPNSSSFFYKCFCILIFANNGAARIRNVSENHGRTEKNIIFASNACVYTYVVLYFYIAT